MNFNDISPWINVGYLILLGGLVVGGLFAMRKGYNKETQEAMARLNASLDGEIKVLRRRVDDLEHERSTQDRVIATIRRVLKEYGLRITIQGDVVTINDGAGHRKSATVQSHATIKPLVASDDEA